MLHTKCLKFAAHAVFSAAAAAAAAGFLDCSI